jgi:FAD/FMN-containing dehydrogenase
MAEDAELRAELSRCLPARSLVFGGDEKAAFEGDWRGLVRNPAEVVLLPASTAEVAEMVRICARHRISIVPQGGNTSLVAGAVPVPGRRQAIINLARMRTVRDLDRLNGTLTVEAGLTLSEAKAVANTEGLMLPVGLASEGSCQIGGNVATNAGGVQALSYGSIRNHVLGVEVVLPDGRVWDGLRALRKDNSGIDLKQLFIGSEGIIGIITAVTLKLQYRPGWHATALLALPTLDAAMTAFVHLKEAFEQELVSCEYFGSEGLDLALRLKTRNRDPFSASHACYVLVEVAGQEAGRELGLRLADKLENLLASGTVSDAVLAQSDAQRTALWALREDISEGERADGGAVKHDIAVPISAIPSTVQRIREELGLASPGARPNIFGHLGDGNLHVNVLPPAGATLTDLASDAPAITEIVEKAAMLVGGTFSAEHGIGQLRTKSLRKYRTPLELEMMHAIKRALDPLWLLNPGKVLQVDEL